MVRDQLRSAAEWTERRDPADDGVADRDERKAARQQLHAVAPASPIQGPQRDRTQREEADDLDRRSGSEDQTGEDGGARCGERTAQYCEAEERIVVSTDRK